VPGPPARCRRHAVNFAAHRREVIAVFREELPMTARARLFRRGSPDASAIDRDLPQPSGLQSSSMRASANVGALVQIVV